MRSALIDWKHVVIQKPKNGSSFYYNYRHTVILPIIAGPNQECLYEDVGTNDRLNDGCLWSKSKISTVIQDNKVGISPSQLLPDPERLGRFPFVFLDDDAFALKLYLLKPYSLQGLTPEKGVFNYKLSRGRRISESLFGILEIHSLTNHTIITLLNPPVVTDIISASLAFYNTLCNSRENFVYCPPGLVVSESSGGDISS